MKISKSSQHLRIAVTNRLYFVSMLIIQLMLLIPFCAIPIILFLPSLLSETPTIFGAVLGVAEVVTMSVTFILIGFGACIDVDSNWLTVKRKPIGFLGNKELPSKTLKQLYCEPARPRFSLKQDDIVNTYTIYALTNDFEEIKLLPNIDEKEDALSIVKEINQFLCLDDNLTTSR
jgi:hypothetical protein